MGPAIVDKHENEAPTDSHALAEESLAQTEPEDKGVCQVEHDDVEVRDVGWNKAQPASEPLIGSLTADESWIWIRRFNKQIFHVKSVTTRPLSGLDMNIADNEDVSPERLRAQMERLYMTVAIGLFSFWKHIVRLRSWREWRRTSLFLLVYAITWLTGLVLPALITFLIVLVLCPPARDVCFPSAPISLIDAKTGGIQKPPSGVLASTKSFTGAPEKHPGEAVEQEAQNFIKSIGKLTASISAGKDTQDNAEEDGDASDPGVVVGKAADAREVSNGDKASVEHDKTKQPVAAAVEKFEVRSTMHMLPDFIDTWERVGNALSPTAPFHSHRPRVILASFLLPWVLIAYAASWDTIAKCLGFCFGFAFFGDPIITPSIALVNRRHPNWRKLVQLRCTILRGVPTNAQVAVTLLRVAERNKAPLPPPPVSHEPPRVGNSVEAKDLAHLGATEGEIAAAVEPQSDDDEVKENDAGKPKLSDRAIGVIKRATKRTIHAVHTIDKAKASAGMGGTKSTLAAIKPSTHNSIAAGPIRFEAHYQGKQGYAFVTTTAMTPAVSWQSSIGKLESAWTVMAGDIVELKKVSGLGWKSKAIVGWALDGEVADGLLLRTRVGEFRLTAVAMRDELFNRLVAIGSQIWEAC